MGRRARHHQGLDPAPSLAPQLPCQSGTGQVPVLGVQVEGRQRAALAAARATRHLGLERRQRGAGNVELQSEFGHGDGPALQASRRPGVQGPLHRTAGRLTVADTDQASAPIAVGGTGGRALTISAAARVSRGRDTSSWWPWCPTAQPHGMCASGSMAPGLRPPRRPTHPSRAEAGRWQLGEVLLLAGRVPTVRAAARKRLVELLERGQALPGRRRRAPSHHWVDGCDRSRPATARSSHGAVDLPLRRRQCRHRGHPVVDATQGARP